MGIDPVDIALLWDPAVVLWGGTRAKTYGYSTHTAAMADYEIVDYGFAKLSTPNCWRNASQGMTAIPSIASRSAPRYNNANVASG